jgi:hypothetical protein
VGRPLRTPRWPPREGGHPHGFFRSSISVPYIRAVLAAHEWPPSRRAAALDRAHHLHLAEAHSATSRTGRAMIAAAHAGADRPWAHPSWTSAARGDCWPAVGRTRIDLTDCARPLRPKQGLSQGLLLSVRTDVGADDPAPRAHHPRSERRHRYVIGPRVGAQDRLRASPAPRSSSAPYFAAVT